MRFITRPLEKWPRPHTRDRRRSPYSVGYAKTLQELERELAHLEVKGDIVIQLDLTEDDVRQDGLPYADAKIRSPRVAIYFSCKHGPLTYYADAFSHWQGNVRAIVLGLHRLRLVEETGIISRGEQYTGFKQLPGGIPVGPAMNLDTAAIFIADNTSNQVNLTAADIANDPMLFKSAYRDCAMRFHPDRGGNVNDWHNLQAAAAAIEAHFKKVGK